MKKYFAFITLSIVAQACGVTQSQDDDMLQGELKEENHQVTVAVASKDVFYQELVSNGRAVANAYADVYWEVDGHVESVAVRNGQHVGAGTVIARLESFKLKNAMESAKASLDNAVLAMKETLIGQGIEPDADDVPESVRNLAEVKSGYRQAKATYEAAEYDYKHCVAVAPISGVVANLTCRPSNVADRNSVLCRIIDQSAMCVDFTIVETELPMVKVNDKVAISAFSTDARQWTGTVAEINPYVEDNGLIKVRAKINAPDGIFEGMKLCVRIKREAGSYVSVPKSAIVMRSNRPVVFTAKKGKAQWCYIETVMDNSESTAIASGIEDGDTVIVSGNAFLAHNSSIRIAK